MVKTITPFSTRAKEGATAAPLGDFVNVDQQITSVADVGHYDINTGRLTGVPTSDRVFIAYEKQDEIANGGTAIAPSANADGSWPLSMVGYNDIVLAIKPSNGGNCAISAIMGPDSNSFMGLTPVNPAALLKGCIDRNSVSDVGFDTLVYDGTESLTADVWNIFMIEGRLANQDLLQFSITNNSGGISTIETAFVRFV